MPGEIKRRYRFTPTQAKVNDFRFTSIQAQVNDRSRHAIKTADVASVIPDFQQEHENWIPPEQHAKAKAAVEASEAKAAAKASEKAGEEEDSHKRQKTDDSTQHVAPPREETTTATSEHLQITPALAPVSLDGLVGSSNHCPWIRTIDLFILIASGNAPGVTPRSWMGKLTEARIRQVGAKAMESKLARSMVDAAKRAALGERGYWTSMQDDSANAELGRGDAAPEAIFAAGVYLRVVIKANNLLGICAGHASCMGFRLWEHMGTFIFYPDTLKHQYQSAKDAEVILTFKFFEDARLNKETADAWEERAIIEALWTLFLGTYVLNDAYNRLRKLYDLPELGEHVRRGNGECAGGLPNRGAGA